MTVNLHKKDFLKLTDFKPEEIKYLITLAKQLKTDKHQKKEQQTLVGKQIALIFEKPSTRTRCAFEIAARDQGANTTYLAPENSQLGKKESVKDTARVLSRLYDGIEYRGFNQSIVEELAEYAEVPVWNGLTNELHPTQALADLLTIQEHSTKPFNEIKVCYIGNADNNTSNSLLIASAQMGMDISIAAPKEYQPPQNIIDAAQKIAQTSGANILITESIEKGIMQADFIYTDVWVSMGESEKVWKERIEKLISYQVTTQMLSATGNPNTKFLHCLPAFHNTETTLGKEIAQRFNITAMEVTEEAFESEKSVVFDQAENRLHTIKAVIVATLADKI